MYTEVMVLQKMGQNKFQNTNVLRWRISSSLPYSSLSDFIFNICIDTNITFQAPYSRIHFNIILHTLIDKWPCVTG